MNANISYNYQKVPGLDTANKKQSLAGLTIALRDATNANRNVNFLFPSSQATPNFTAGSPTAGIRGNILPDEIVKYAGQQLPL